VLGRVRAPREKARCRWRSNGREHLRHVQVAETALGDYAGLLAAGGGGA